MAAAPALRHSAIAGVSRRRGARCRMRRRRLGHRHLFHPCSASYESIGFPQLSLAAIVAVGKHLTDELCVGDLALVLDVTEDAASYALNCMVSGS